MEMIRILMSLALVLSLLPLAAQEEINLALGKKVSASSHERKNPPEFGTDGKKDTEWVSQRSDPQWLMVDLGRPETVGRIVIFWGGCFSREYKIQSSSDGRIWEEVYFAKAGKGQKEEIRFAPRKTRFVRLAADRRSSWNGCAVREFRIFEK